MTNWLKWSVNDNGIDVDTDEDKVGKWIKIQKWEFTPCTLANETTCSHTLCLGIKKHHISTFFSTLLQTQDDLASKGKTWQEGQLQQWARRGLEGEASGGAPPGDHDNGEMHYDDRQCGELHDDDGELHHDDGEMHYDQQCGELMCYRKWESSLLTSTQAAHLKKHYRHYRHYHNSHHSVVAPSSSSLLETSLSSRGSSSSWRSSSLEIFVLIFLDFDHGAIVPLMLKARRKKNTSASWLSFGWDEGAVRSRKMSQTQWTP